MNKNIVRTHGLLVGVAAVALLSSAPVLADDPSAALSRLLQTRQLNGVSFPNASGVAATVSRSGVIDLNNEFFQDLGANGRRCVSCHLPSAGWTVTPAQVRAVFNATQGGVVADALGLGAIFRSNDGANSPNAPVASLSDRRRAYSMLLGKGLIRVGLPVPATADFALIAVDDPYGYASANELSLFRRPLPTTNLQFLSTVMWDGRETLLGPGTCPIAAGAERRAAQLDRGFRIAPGHGAGLGPQRQGSAGLWRQGRAGQCVLPVELLRHQRQPG